MSMKILNNPPLLLMRGNRSDASYQKSEMRALDENSMFWANRLLSNRMHAYTLEISIGNVELLVEVGTVVAVVGGDIPFFINGRIMQINRTHKVKRGDIITFKFFKKRLRTYLAVKGGFDFTEEEGEQVDTPGVATQSAVSNFRGGNFRGGDRFRYVTNNEREDFFSSFISHGHLPIFGSPLVLRVVLGAQGFSDPNSEKRLECEKLLMRPYEVSSLSNSWEYHLEPSGIKKLSAFKNNRMGKANDVKMEDVTKIQEKVEIIVKQVKSAILKESKKLQTTSKLPEFAKLHISRRYATVLLQSSAHPTSIDTEVIADGFVLPIDSFKLAQLPAGKKVIFEVISSREALHIQNDFLRFFQTTSRRGKKTVANY